MITTKNRPAGCQSPHDFKPIKIKALLSFNSEGAHDPPVEIKEFPWLDARSDFTFTFCLLCPHSKGHKGLCSVSSAHYNAH